MDDRLVLLIKKYPHNPWDWDYLSSQLPWDVIAGIFSGHDGSRRELGRPIKRAVRYNEKQSQLNWSRVSRRYDLTWSIIQNTLRVPWDMNELSKNPNIDWQIICDNPNMGWVWEGISRNPNITPGIIDDNLDKPWDYISMSHNTFYIPLIIIERRKENVKCVIEMAHTISRIEIPQVIEILIYTFTY